MKSDINGCSACAKGSENYESYTSRIGLKKVRKIQYDYRHTDGELFSCVKKTLAKCRQARDKWLEDKRAR